MPIIELQETSMEPNLAQREPVLTAATAGALVAALVTVLVQFGVPITDAQADAISVFVAVAFPIAAATVARRKATPADQVVERLGGNGTVVAGPANELPTDAMIRDVGEPDYAPEEGIRTYDAEGNETAYFGEQGVRLNGPI